ncbi:MAG TPA: DUF5819 family protein [Actinospica sp.]|nr:DUF5819 family protein [Actinospica sp.]
MDEAPTATTRPTPAPRRPGRRWSRALVGATAAATAVVVATQLAATFLYNAPANPISRRYQAQVSWWMDPLLNQNWQLFAPNPISENLELDARASLGATAAVTPWLNISAIDQANTVDDPAPGHLTMNALRNAWREYATTHGSTGLPDSPLAGTAQQYLQNLVLGYLRPRESGTIDSVQVRFVVTLIPGPGRSAAQTAPQTQTLSWWVVGS